ncbi:hypothetical protein GCM10022226_46880 [Sphaerisporangium flaviroseum]|uniref:Uncharacterized protein n=1 Tax=Sphaerisporangium flaviroseum TaxID=509199 RepID=A0ABP7ILU1_9ACTN
MVRVFAQEAVREAPMMSDSRFAPIDPITVIPATPTAGPGSATAKGASALAHSVASSARGVAHPSPCAE